MRLVVYGTLKRGGALHGHMENVKAKFIEESSLEGFRMHNMGWYPAIMEHPGSKVKVEVYEIPDESLTSTFDRVEGYPGLYQRKETNLGMVYYMDRELDELEYPVIEDGNWKVIEKD